MNEHTRVIYVRLLSRNYSDRECSMKQRLTQTNTITRSHMSSKMYIPYPYKFMYNNDTNRQ